MINKFEQQYKFFLESLAETHTLLKELVRDCNSEYYEICNNIDTNYKKVRCMENNLYYLEDFLDKIDNITENINEISLEQDTSYNISSIQNSVNIIPFRKL